MSVLASRSRTVRVANAYLRGATFRVESRQQLPEDVFVLVGRLARECHQQHTRRFLLENGLTGRQQVGDLSPVGSDLKLLQLPGDKRQRLSLLQACLAICSSNRDGRNLALRDGGRILAIGDLKPRRLGGLIGQAQGIARPRVIPDKRQVVATVAYVLNCFQATCIGVL